MFYPALDGFENGVIDYSITHSPFSPMGTVATHSCNQGYVLIGSKNKTCVDNPAAGFGRQPPVCDPKTCHNNRYVYFKVCGTPVSSVSSIQHLKPFNHHFSHYQSALNMLSSGYCKRSAKGVPKLLVY